VIYTTKNKGATMAVIDFAVGDLYNTENGRVIVFETGNGPVVEHEGQTRPVLWAEVTGAHKGVRRPKKTDNQPQRFLSVCFPDGKFMDTRITGQSRIAKAIQI